ncbi:MULTISPECIES: DUF2877 domain-containing protein [unclassified Exiguobacterium]|uniref:DUF2877 domain-containing protein n=1 Tax=unclassified Exiguobacterium TaxID=2644629 RepID=UPI0006486FFB|nr:DUF2877 domain-containing protein [Exiguobacterium sp. ZOR0005]
MFRLEGVRRDATLDVGLLNGQIGYVHSVFQNVLNIELIEQDRLIAVSTPRRPLAPDMVQLKEALDFRSVAPDIGTRVVIGEGFTFENGLTVSLDAAPVDLHVKARVIDAAAVEALYTFLVAYGKEGGMLRPYRKRIEAVSIGRWNTEERFIDQVMKEGELTRLIGLGPGLTPAGDDYVTGRLLAAHLLGRPLDVPLDVIRLSRDKTTRVSYHMLRHAYHGRTNEAVLDLFHTLTDLDALKRVLAIGSTSGTDFLVGVHAGIIAQRSGNRDSSNDREEEDVS